MIDRKLDSEGRAPRHAANTCAICGKALGTRRVRQGLSVHPNCRRSGFDSSRVEQALTQTRATLDRLGAQAGDPDSEVEPLLHAASEQARDLVEDLRKLRDFYAPTPAPEEGREETDRD